MQGIAVDSEQAKSADEKASFQTLARFLPYLWPENAPALRLRIVLALALVLVSKSLQIGTAFFFGWAIDKMAPGMEPGVLLAIGLMVAYTGARFGGVLFDNIRNAIFETVGQDAARRLSVIVFRHIHGLSLRYHLERKTGALTRIVERGTKNVDSMLYFLLFNVAPTVIELSFACIYFYLNFGPGLALATLAMIIAYIVYTQRITQWRIKVRKEWTESDTNATQRAVDSLLNYETVKYFNAEDRETERYSEAVAKLTKANVKIESSLAWLNIGQSLITNLLMAGAITYTIWGWSKGQYSTGTVTIVNMLLLQLFRPLDMLGMVYREIRQGLVDMAAMFDLVDTAAEIQDKADAKPLSIRGGGLTFDDVHFGYSPERPILKGVSFTVAPGATLAVVGPSGAGKSTIARLLYRFYDVTGGQILIDNQDLRDVQQSSLRAAIGIVPQDTVLFNDTIGYNVGYGKDGASIAEIEDAARGAAIHDFISALPEGYQAPVGERGLKLSGGEKQRVAIARTLLKDPPILILDEATSALDSRTESEIQDTLNRVSEKRTTIVIAHRLSTIVDADEIVVLDAGRVAERGKHAELLKKRGLYAEMWARQQAESEGEETVAAE
jgi:ATP-binding cassette, subfamily B, heavy metal transporter